MDDTGLERLRTLLNKTRADGVTLQPCIAQLGAAVEAGRLLDARQVEETVHLLETYVQGCTALFDAGKAILPEVEGVTISDVEHFIALEEEALRCADIRRVVTQYYQLNAEANDVKTALENSKLLLMKLLLMGHRKEKGVQTLLGPFRLVVQKVTENGTLSEEEFDEIENAISRPIARALDRKDLHINPELDIRLYLDDSDEEAKREAQNADAATCPAQPANEDLPKRLWEHFDGYCENVLVSFRDVPAKALTASNYISMAKRRPEMALAVFIIAHQILLEGSDGNDNGIHYYAPSLEMRELLANHGYINTITLQTERETREFLTLTSKAWASFSRAEVVKYLNSKMPGYVVPRFLRIKTSELTPCNLMRLAMLHDYHCSREPKENYMIFPKGPERFIISERLSDKTATVKVAAGIFREGDEREDLDALQRLIEELRTEDRMVILVKSENDERCIRAQIDFEKVNRDHISFLVL